MAIVVSGAICRCSFGLTPTALIVIPKCFTTITGLPIATTMDCISTVNLMSFGMCAALSNPSVVAATAAAFGVLTPVPCVPVIVPPWKSSKGTISIPSGEAFHDDATCSCKWGGTICIISAGQILVK